MVRYRPPHTDAEVLAARPSNARLRRFANLGRNHALLEFKSGAEIAAVAEELLRAREKGGG